VLDLCSQVVDRLRDSGVDVSTQAAVNIYAGYDASSLVTFLVEDGGSLRELARQRAFGAARATAESLARLAGVRLGGVLAVQEASDDSTSNEGPYVGEHDLTRPPANQVRLQSAKLAPIPVKVTLHVRFALMPGAKE
jgi:uncharacterized protein YggE